MNTSRQKHPKHIQVAVNASLMVRILAFPPLLIGILLLPAPRPSAIFLATLMVVVWIPLTYFLAMTSKKPIRTEIISLHIEAAIAGIIMPLIAFNPIFVLVALVITGMGGIAYGGFPLCIKRYLSLGLGVGIGVLFVGVNYRYEPSLLTVSIMGLSVLFSTFAISYGSLTGAKKALTARTALKEKTTELEALTKTLAMYLSPQVYNFIVLGGKKVRAKTSRKKLTIFFSDIKGFTETTDGMEPEALTYLLNNYFNEMAEIALQYGGTLDKFIGDATLIFFGDPESKGEAEDAEACVRMAIEMRERMKHLRKKWEDEGIERPLHIRCGINTGFCTVGNFGSKSRLDYTIIGGPVNLAQRLESHAKPDQILISQNTHALVKDKIFCENKGEINGKGIAQPFQTFQVVDTHDDLTKDRTKINDDIKGFLESLQHKDLSSSDKNYIVEKISKRL